MPTLDLRCPRCGSDNIATRPRAGVLLKLLRLIDPFECRSCHRAFVAFTFSLDGDLRQRLWDEELASPDDGDTDAHRLRGLPPSARS
jgi:hypothetical protein